MHKQTGSPQIRKMFCAKLFRLARRMQRIGQQKESSHELWFIRAEHRSLPSAIRMPAEKDSPRYILAQDSHRIRQPGAVKLGISK